MKKKLRLKESIKNAIALSTFYIMFILAIITFFIQL